MKKLKSKIENFREVLEERFKDPFEVKRDMTNRVVSRYNQLLRRLERILWYD